MALNVGESSALAVVLRALGVNVHGRVDSTPLRDGQLLVALGTLTASAGKTLRLGWDPDDLRALDARLALTGLLPTAADIELLAVIRDGRVRSDMMAVALLDPGPDGGTDVTRHAEALARQGWAGPTGELATELRPWLLTTAGRRVLEVADPSRCHLVNLAGRRCWRSGPHADWVCDFEAVPSGS